jgi:hypothetical protein
MIDNRRMEISSKTKQYYKKEDWSDLEKAETFSQLYTVAERVIARMPKSLIQVCGPISTGGKGSVKENLELLNETVKELQAQNVNVFDQMPYEEPIYRMRLLGKIEGYREDILTDFYLPIFESGCIQCLYFLPDWQSSHGAMWEHEQAKRLGIKIKYI